MPQESNVHLVGGPKLPKQKQSPAGSLANRWPHVQVTGGLFAKILPLKNRVSKTSVIKKLHLSGSTTLLVNLPIRTLTLLQLDLETPSCLDSLDGT